MSEIRNEKDRELMELISDSVREGARQGAREGSKRGTFGISIWMFLITAALVICLGTAMYYGLKLKNSLDGIGSSFEKESKVDVHDLKLENHGFRGYTAADFEEAILGDPERLKKLEVYTADVSDAAQLTDTGLGNFKIFTKYQYITYNGSAVYSVDLARLRKEDIRMDEASKIVTLRIPEPQMDPINIPADDIEFGDIRRGVLALGKISVTPEELAEVQKEAQSKMLQKLEKEKASEEAARFAKLSVWEVYQPVITGAAPGYSLEVTF